MTPYGSFSDREALKRAEIPCESPYYLEGGEAIWDNEALLIRHNLWTILRVTDQITHSLEDGSLTRHLEHLIEVHQRLFPDSQLRESWYALHEGGE